MNRNDIMNKCHKYFLKFIISKKIKRKLVNRNRYTN
jgi:hypothetical protein